MALGLRGNLYLIYSDVPLKPNIFNSLRSLPWLLGGRSQLFKRFTDADTNGVCKLSGKEFHAAR